MQLSKRQIKSLLDVISSDAVRPAITHLAVTKINNELYLTATDGYHLAALQVSKDWEPHVEKGGIPRAELVKWYKLATAKDVLVEQELFTMVVDMGVKYPPIEAIINNERGQVGKIGLNAQYVLNLQTIAEHPLIWTFGNSHLNPIISNDNHNIYVVMPVKA